MHPAEQDLIFARLKHMAVTQRNENRGAVITHDIDRYLDASRFENEKACLQKFPVLFGLSRDIEPGAFRSADHLGKPVLVTRNAQGDLRAFLNVCRHRATTLVEKCSGRATKFTCPFHGWTYAADGALIGIPDKESFSDIERKTLGLTALPIVERQGMIWILLTDDTPHDLSEWVEALCPDFGNYSLNTADLFYTKRFRYNFNWKLGVETFLEAYHFASLHKTSIANVFHSNRVTFDSYGPNTRGIISRRTLDDIETLETAPHGLLPHCAGIYGLFPCTLFFWQGDHFEIWRVYPGDSVDDSILEFSLYAPEPVLNEKADAHWQANVDLALGVITVEDFPAAEDIHRNIRSGATDCIRFGPNEAGLSYFHACLDDALGLTPNPVNYKEIYQ